MQESSYNIPRLKQSTGGAYELFTVDKDQYKTLKEKFKMQIIANLFE